MFKGAVMRSTKTSTTPSGTLATIYFGHTDGFAIVD
jgi:hypothetical protein